jgi:hypothetical protein
MSSIPTTITAAHIAALEKALAAGVLEVSYSSNGVSHSTRYNSIGDLLKALEYARARYAEQLAGAAKPATATFALFSRS